MDVLKLTRGNAVLVAIMNACVRKCEVGNFILQLNVTCPARKGAGQPDFNVGGYTDTGRLVAASVFLSFCTDDLRLDMVSATVQFSHCEGDGMRCTVKDTFKYFYSSVGGVVVIKEKDWERGWETTPRCILPNS